MWYKVKPINDYVDSLAYFFLGAEVQNVGLSTDGSVFSVTGVDSIKSRRFGESTSFLQVAHMTYNSEDYLYVLNSRVDDGTWGLVDSQTVDFFASGEGLYRFVDVYTGEADTLWDSCGVVQWSKHLDPGKAVLVRYEAVRATWSGTLYDQWTWPRFSTINITGDVTFSQPLTINTNRIRIPSYSDATASGSDTQKTEIRIYNSLTVNPAEGDTIVFETVSGGDSSWTGFVIEVEGNARVYVEDAVIRNAWCGMWLNNNPTDTILNTTFENCHLFGLKLGRDSNYIAGCTFKNTKSLPGTGISSFYDLRATQIVDCSFEGVKYPIFAYFRDNGLITGCSFDRAGVSIGATPAVETYMAYDLTLEDCDFDNYDVAIDVGYRCTTQVEYCRFAASSRGSDHSIYGNASQSLSTVRNCCFLGANDSYVFGDTSTIDLGTLADYGLNYFELVILSSKLPDDDTIPTYFIENASQTTMQACGNVFDTDIGGFAYISQYLSGPINYDSSDIIILGSQGDQYYDYCIWEEGMIGHKVSLASSDPITPDAFQLNQNYPNPFNPSTQISFTLPRQSSVTIEIFNVLGQRLRTLFDGNLPAGDHVLQWDGTTGGGERVASGVYFYRVSTPEVIESKKMVLLK